MIARGRVPAIGNVFWLHCRNNHPSMIRPFCVHSNGAAKLNAPLAETDEGGRRMTREEAYNQLGNLDFMTAAKILFTAPPKRKKFGLDFHLVQLFFACLPSLAVYFVAQYARADMKKMDEELKLKRRKAEEEEKEKAEEEEKAKEAEMASKEKVSDAELLKVKDRLDALEEVLKEITDETKKFSKSNIPKEVGIKRKEPTNIVDVPNKQPVAIAKESSDSRT